MARRHLARWTSDSPLATRHFDHRLDSDKTLAGTPSIVAAYIALFIVWAAAWVDLRTRRIPNPISLAGIGLGLLTALELGGAEGLMQSLAGLGLGTVLLLPGYLLRSTGAGDVKLTAAVGALLGPKGVLLAFVVAILTGALIGIGYALMAWRLKGARSPFERYGQMLRYLFTTGRVSYVPPAADEIMGQRFAFGVPIAIGTTVAALWLA